MSTKITSRIAGLFPSSALALGVLAMVVAGCNSNNPTPNSSNQAQNAAMQASDESQDPAEQANLAPAVQTAPAPADQQDAYNAPESDEQATYAPEPPPPLPDYDQPEAPGPDYIWTPGYWNYANAGYYWVPGTWVLAPYAGSLWTPGYWGFYRGRYLWHRGYWGPHVGFYGGVDYGHGYTGVGYVGGYWNNGSFMYNKAVTRVGSDIHNTYSHRVRVVKNPRVSYNGGRGGLSARPLTSERVASRERHLGPLPAQQQHRQQASQDRGQWARQNHGHPKTLAATQPLNAGRHAPDSMPPDVRDQVQRERQGHAPAEGSRSSRPETRPENRQPSQSQANRTARPNAAPPNHQPARNEARPTTHPEARRTARPQTGGTAARAESRQTERNKARPATQPKNTRGAHPAARTETEQKRQQQHRREQPQTSDQNPQL